MSDASAGASARNHDGVPAWDNERAKALVGKSVIVGVTTVGADGKTVLGREQFHGMIMTAVEGRGIEIVCLSGPNEGKTITLPPTTTPYFDAKPGDYKLKSTGEVVTNPDVTVAWTVHQKA